MAKDAKFGTFGGVFTPSILTILGVIMYLRLPWVVGNAGLYAAIGIIGVSHVISICTGLSISSIATDKNVGAGGPYYIVSRSLGLPIGGTLGLALFAGLSFSISLYVIGFSESLLSYVGIAAGPTAIRICGTITILALTGVTLVSTAFAIKTQYFILAAIASSLVAIFLGSPEAPATPQLKMSESAPSMGVLFGIFFPAVTGFTAGVNMSGDLRDPKKSIPRGTMAAVLVGMVVYVSLAIYLARNVPAEQLVENNELLLDNALHPAPVLAGIWGATLSSGLGSILGAPRILQALASDGITLRWFAKGYGKTNEPRNALLLAFAIGEGGILIAELDAIASIVSMVFLATYGFLNFSCAIESWASPDFRPAFRIPRWVSVLGALTSLLVMVQLDLTAMFGATALMAGLFVYLQRRQLTLDSGDTWEGVWSSLVRSGLYRLSLETAQQRNWRPNILMFAAPDVESRAELFEIGEKLITGNGILTDFRVVSSKRDDKPDGERGETRPGVFSRTLPTKQPNETIASLCRFHGFGGLEPNTVLMPWDAHGEDADAFASLLGTLAELDYNVLLYAHGRSEAVGARIDVWWRPEAGNLQLCLSLLRFITRSDDWSSAKLRFLLVSDDSANNDALRSATRRILENARVDAELRVINPGLGSDTLEQRIRDESGDAALTVLGLANDPAATTGARLLAVDVLVRALGPVLLVRASSFFEESLAIGRQEAISFLPPRADDGEARELPQVPLPDAPELAAPVSELAEVCQQLASQLHEQCVKRLYSTNIELVREIRAIADRHFAQLEKGIAGTNPRRRRNVVNRVQSSFSRECTKTLEAHRDEVLQDQLGLLEAGIEAFIEHEALAGDGRGDRSIRVHRPRELFEPSDGDTPYLVRFKRRRRWLAALARDQPWYKVPVGPLRAHYLERTARDLLVRAVRLVVTDTHRSVVQLGKLLNSSKTSLTLLADELEHTEDVERFVSEQRELTDQHLVDLADESKARVARMQWDLLVAARGIAADFAKDIERLDVRPLVARERQSGKAVREMRAELAEVPSAWLEHQRALLERALLGLSVTSFQHRLATIANREKEQIALDVKNGTRADCLALRDRLLELREQLAERDGPPPELKLPVDFKPHFDTARVVEALVRDTSDAASDLPDTVNTLTDESIQLLEEGSDEAPIEFTELPVRRLVQFLVESELIGGLREELASAPRAEQQAASVAREVVRLMSFHVGELELADEHESAQLEGQLLPVVESGIERLDAELEQLSRISPELANALDRKLALVIEGTNAYDLTRTSSNLDQHIRLAQGRRAVSGARSLLRRGTAAAKHGVARLMYRRTSGVVLAKQLRADARGAGRSVDKVLSFVTRNSPAPDVVEALPFFYRQLFVGQSAVSDSVWVGRSEQLARAKRALSELTRGKRGAVLVTGERGSGKTALCQRIVSGQFQRVVRLHAPPGGSAAPEALRSALSKATSLEGSLRQLMTALPEKSALVIDDLELWWERSPEGLRVIDTLLDLIERWGDRTAFVLGMGTQAFRFVNRTRPLGDATLAVLECGPMPAEHLEQLIALRHGSTGLSFNWGGRPEDELSEWRRARLFSSHFDWSLGNPGAALRSWITHIDAVDDGVVRIRAPDAQQWDALDDLRGDWVALLVQLILHKQLTLPGLRRVTRLDGRELERTLDTLSRSGLVVRRQRVVEVNPYVHHILIDRLDSRGLLA